MLIDKLTPWVVTQYHVDLLQHINAYAFDKSDISEALKVWDTTTDLFGVIDKALSAAKTIGVQDPIELIKTTAVSIPAGQKIGNYILLPWNPGETDDFSLAAQVEVIGHEAEHILRASKREGWVLGYAANFSFRCSEERKAYQASLELCWMLYGKLPPIDSIMADHAKYYLRPTDVDVLRAGLEAVSEPIKQGDRSTPIGKWSYKWFADKGLV